VELEYSDKNSRRSKVYIAVGTIVALLVAATVYLALQGAGLTDADEVSMRDVVVANVAISSRQAVAASDVVVRSVIADPTNETAFTSVNDVVGRIVSVPIAAGQLLSANMLASTTAGQTFSILEPGDPFDPEGAHLRAVSVSVADASAVAGTLVPGQRVDLIVTMPINPVIEPPAEGSGVPVAAQLAGPSTKVTLQRMTILARNGGVYILRADIETTEKIVELTAAGGVFTMVLRPEEDDRTAETQGSTIDRLIEEYGFPVPRTPAFQDGASADGTGN
jgi:Flp pilus assembly protein CpaB